VAGRNRIASSLEGRQKAADLAVTESVPPGQRRLSLADYVARTKHQSIQATGVRPEQLADAFESLVLGDDMLLRVGTAVVSGTSMFLYGAAGHGQDQHRQPDHRDLQRLRVDTVCGGGGQPDYYRV